MGTKGRFRFGWGLFKNAFRHGVPRFFNLTGSTVSALLSTSRAPFLPPILFIEVTTKCNLHCAMCPHTFQHYENKNMSYEDFEAILKQFPALSRLIPQGIGESLLWDSIFPAIRLARSRGISVELNTNGTLLTEEKARGLIESGVDVLSVSIDGATEATYQSIRGGDLLKPVLANFRRMVELKNELGAPLPHLGVRIVAMKSNLEEIPQIIDIAAQVGVDEVVVQDLIDYEGLLRQMLVDEEDYSKLLRYQREASGKGVRMVLENFSRFKDHKRRCVSPWLSPYITREGYVTPCCIITDPSIVNFGNAFTASFREIWNNEQFVAFRKDFREGKAPSFCQHCPRY